MSAIYNYALRITKDSDEAADLVQETFLRAYRFFDSFEPGTNCKAWLFRILKNTYINLYRRNLKAPEMVEYEAVEEFYETIRDSTADAETLEDIVINRSIGDEVASAIEALPDEFRSVVILCDIEQLTYDEIAEFLDCPIGTVRSRLHRARKILAKTLADYARQHGWSKREQ